ncbi:histidine phosphotransferase family protein [Vannielia sp.]|uniref:histidine phosphotransferase family protein n=1 Tax=Vannielia sp. TaxID=2813045 RepID=UPI002609A91D|nr:histidine phosphotransferase family protein [Vannielia sp.]MDF1872589.1 histidine phosphotransferase family protein [Vannielia sp.]
MDEGFDLAMMLASRICHDLISPVGAIGNGVELLGMTGLAGSPELTLVGDSVKNAEARIKFFRIAFGQADANQSVGEREIASTLADYYAASKTTLLWPPTGPVARQDLRAIFLSLLCLETELAFGGTVDVMGTSGESWVMTARAERTRGEEPAWAAMAARSREGLSPAMLQFALLPLALDALDRTLRVARDDTEITIAF